MKEIPQFDCEPGCNACCGLVPFTTAERGKVQAVRPLEQWEPFGNGAWVPTAALANFTCPFITKGGCGIYDIRPMVCRLFGSVDHPMLECPKGCGPKQKLTDQQSRQILSEVAA